jgi:hypothetical protein
MQQSNDANTRKAAKELTNALGFHPVPVSELFANMIP